MQDIRCKSCNKLLGKATIIVAAIKCPRCYQIYEYHIYTNTLYSNNTFDNRNKRDTIPPESNATS
jgi:phage FluMu protein Com